MPEIGAGLFLARPVADKLYQPRMYKGYKKGDVLLINIALILPGKYYRGTLGAHPLYIFIDGTVDTLSCRAS